ncbi:disease resistance protein RPV1-like [Bidens hawaiensis]|uniref:disease resistance protein RPV1-like n=1 Tax=Bidens hawaiensis TaxID=980011 RepID=UPI00404BA40B
MASTSSSASQRTPTIRFDVFLSFRGEDTRHTFTDHLYHALIRAGLRTFRDNDEINRGQELKQEIETAITESRACVVVLSENYATSRWCLDELCLIFEQRRKCNYFVLPVFYQVDPSNVRNQRGSFAINRSRPVDDVRRWNAALTDVANLTGMVLSGSETNFIAEVVETVQCKLDFKQLSTSTPAHLTGMETRVEVINSWLKNEESSALAICGMGGSGKTTLAQHIYNLSKQHFHSSSFIEVAGKQHDELLGLQKQLLKDVSGGKKIRISSVFEGTQKIEEALRIKKMLIVLDDIDQHEQISALLGTKDFPTQSKIIITTRILHVKAWLATLFWKCWVHEIELLNDLESLELLSFYAFRSITPPKYFKELVVQLACYCGGNPLALKVLGSSLYFSDENPVTINDMKGIWISRINSLNSLKGNIDFKIQGLLRKSFDSLPQPSERELFLHIACFFVGERKYFIEMILEDELYAKSGILTLINRCLLTISVDGKLMMHQLLQEMGRKIVYEESKDPAKRSRVWHPQESYSVLRRGDGSNTIEGLSLDMRKVEQGMRQEELTLETKFLANMNKLKLLQLKYVKLTGSYDNFPKLLWLCWHGCTLPKMPPGLLASTLVVLDMSDGHLKMFEAPMVLNSLKTLNLKGCDKLVSICNLYRLPKLVRLILFQGLFKLVPVEKMDERDLGHMQWIKAYANHKVDLVGDEITKGRIWRTQMLYEYGIMTTYLQGIKHSSLPRYEYTSSCGSLSFHVPFQNEKNKIQGLSVICLYTSKDKDVWNLMAKISNKTKGLTWLYSPIVYCKPRVDEYIVWVSYWPIGNVLDVGDEVNVVIYVQKGKMIIHNCGASLVYMDSEVDEEETYENNLIKNEEVIGGDLSDFKVATGCYYLCRKNLFGLKTSYWLKYFFGDNVHYEDSQGWRKTHQSNLSRRLRDIEKAFLKIIELRVSFNSESETDKIEKAVSGIVGVEYVSAYKETGKLIVTGYADPIEVVTCAREFDIMAEILSFKPLIKYVALKCTDINYIEPCGQLVKMEVESCSTTKAPKLLRGIDLIQWNEIFEQYIKWQDAKMWVCIEYGYIPPTTTFEGREYAKNTVR